MSFFDSILNILFPPRCAACKKEGDFMCKNCVQGLRIRPIRKSYRDSSKNEFRFLDGLIYGADYAENPGLQAAISQFKYKFNRRLADYFAKILCEKLSELEMLRSRRMLLIPVPLHRKRLNVRGFNQAELIARETAARFKRDASVLPLLIRVKNTSQQARLSRNERLKNLHEAFEMNDNLTFPPEAVCFLVDDVCTTGATLENCARALKAGGMKKVYGLVVARAFK